MNEIIKHDINNTIYPFFDAHSDVLSDLFFYKNLDVISILQKYFLPMWRSSAPYGTILVNWVRPIDKSSAYQDIGSAEKIFAEYFEHSIKTLNKAESLGLIKVIKEYKDLSEYLNLSQDELLSKPYPVMIGMEGIGLIGNISLEYLYNCGVRHVAFTWNEGNRFATGARADAGSGLSKEGKNWLREIVDRKIIFDVSHLNDKSFWDVCDQVDYPIMASHSNCRSICGNLRNLTDEQIIEIGRRKGIVGLNMYKRFIGDNEQDHNLEKFVDHLDHIVSLIGIDCVGCGFDFAMDTDSIYDRLSHGPDGFQGSYQIKFFYEAMKNRGYKSEEIRKIAYENMYKFIMRF